MLYVYTFIYISLFDVVSWLFRPYPHENRKRSFRGCLECQGSHLHRLFRWCWSRRLPSSWQFLPQRVLSTVGLHQDLFFAWWSYQQHVTLVDVPRWCQRHVFVLSPAQATEGSGAKPVEPTLRNSDGLGVESKDTIILIRLVYLWACRG